MLDAFWQGLAVGASVPTAGFAMYLSNHHRHDWDDWRECKMINMVSGREYVGQERYCKDCHFRQLDKGVV